jgi:hypothetical protein
MPEGEEAESFLDVVDRLVPNAEEYSLLPFCHTTTEGYAVNIGLKKGLIPRTCKEYKESLTYLFYGKASFVTADEEDIYTDDPPMTFIFDGEDMKQYLIRSFKRLLPFDSGGFDRYKFRRGFERNDYTSELPEPWKILALIKLIYGNEIDKYLNDLIVPDSIDAHSDRCAQLKEMLRMYRNVKIVAAKTGKQVYSIEVQIAEVLPLLPIYRKPIYLVLPYNLFIGDYWGKTFRNQFPFVKLIQYGENEIIRAGGDPLEAGEYQFLMREKVRLIINDLKNGNQP